MFQHVYKDKTVLVTGNTGFKGCWLSNWLLNLGAKVIGVSNGIPTKPSLFHILNSESRLEQHQIDITDFDQIKQLIDQVEPDVIFHLAAQALTLKAYRETLNTIKTNVLGSATILEALRDYQKPCSVVMVTSDKCYENVEWYWGYRETDTLGGKDPYSASKGSAEIIIHSYQESIFQDSEFIKIASARAGNVIGGGDWAPDRVVPDCYRAWSQERPVALRSPESVRPWQHVLEPVSGYLTLGMFLLNGKNVHNEAFNFGPYYMEKHTVQDLVEGISKFWHFTGEAKGYIQQKEGNYHEATYLKLNCDKALSLLNWQTTLSFEELTKMTGDWYTAYYQSEKDMKRYSDDQILQYQELAKDRNMSWAT